MKEKIIELFEYRKLPELLKKGHYGLDSSLVDKLVELQMSIYHLDTYLETTWETKTHELNKYWKHIDKAMEGLGIAKARRPDYLKYIYKYQEHELAMRKGKFPTSLSIEYYYFYKSCDVKLIRRIIYDYIPELKQDYSLGDWRQFDLITEINDDVEDLFEDLEIINGNYFLFDLDKNGSKKVSKRFIKYLQQLDKQSKARIRNNKSMTQKKLLEWSLINSKETQALIKTQVKVFDDSRMSLNLPLENKST